MKTAYPSGVTPLKLLLIAPDPLARTALATLLSQDVSVQVVGQADGGADWHDLLDIHSVDLILCDVGWQTSLQLPDLRELAVPTLVLVPDQDAANAVWQSGATAILGRDVSAEMLTPAIQSTAANLVTIDPNLLPSTLDTHQVQPLIEPLTDRERDVINLLAQGMTNRAIAHTLSISDHTVKFHVNALMSKLAAQSRTEAAVKATRLGLTTL